MTKQRPDRLAILFADVSGSVRLFDSMGDAKAFEMIKACINIMTREVKRHHGTLVKTIGDEIMCTFPTSDAAMQAATAMQEKIENDVTGSADADTTGLHVRIGANFGPVIHQGNDVFGDAVNVAARMASIAKGGQIVITGKTAAQLSGALRGNTQLVDQLSVKGKRKPIEVYSYVWETEDATVALASSPSGQVHRVHLSLSYRGERVSLDQDSDTFVIGRGEHADLRILDSNASRVHVHIESSRGRFLITDDSVNGTVLATPAGEVHLHKKETATLTGSGLISLGRDVEDNPEIVTYTCDA